MDNCLSLYVNLSLVDNDDIQLDFSKVNNIIQAAINTKSLLFQYNEERLPPAIIDNIESDISSSLGVDFTTFDSEISRSLDTEQFEQLSNYLWACNTILDCLQLAVVPDRKKIEDLIFLSSSLT